MSETLLWSQIGHTHRTLVDKFAGHTEHSHVQVIVHNTCTKVSLSQVDWSQPTVTILWANLSFFRKRK